MPVTEISPTTKRLLSDEFTDIENFAAEASGDKEWKSKFALSNYMSERMGIDNKKIFNRFDYYNKLLFGEKEINSTLEAARKTTGVQLKTEKAPELIKEAGKSLVRGTESLISGGISGAASLLGEDDIAKAVSIKTSEKLEEFKQDPRVAAKLRAVMEEEGVIAQLFNPEWYVTKGAELLPNIAVFGAGALGVGSAAQLLFRSRVLSTLAAGVATGAGEGVVESGGAIRQVDELVESSRIAEQFLRKLPEEQRAEIVNSGVLQSMEYYKKVIDTGSDSETAGKVAAQVFKGNLIFNSILNSVGFISGRVLASRIFKGSSKTQLFSAVAGALGLLGAEPEQELRQDEIIDTAVLENLLGKASDTNIFSSRLLGAILGDDLDKKDTALAAFIMGVKNPVVGLAMDLSESKALFEAEGRMDSVIDVLESQKEKDDISQELITKYKRAKTVDEKSLVVQEAAKKILDDNIDVLDSTIEQDIEERAVFQEELEELKEQTRASGIDSDSRFKSLDFSNLSQFKSDIRQQGGINIKGLEGLSGVPIAFRGKNGKGADEALEEAKALNLVPQDSTDISLLVPLLKQKTETAPKLKKQKLERLPLGTAIDLEGGSRAILVGIEEETGDFLVDIDGELVTEKPSAVFEGQFSQADVVEVENLIAEHGEAVELQPGDFGEVFDRGTSDTLKELGFTENDDFSVFSAIENPKEDKARASTKRIQDRVKALGFGEGIVEVVETIEGLPESIQQDAVNAFGPGAQGVQGVFYKPTGKVYIVSKNIRNDRIDEVLLHEVAGHKGLRDLFGEEKLQKVLGQVFDGLPAELLADTQRRYGLKKPIEKGLPGAKELNAEEFLAKLAEDNNPDPNLLQKVYAAIRELLRELGIVKDFTDNDLRVLLSRARKAVTKSDNVQEQGVSRFSSPDPKTRKKVESDVRVDLAGRMFRGDKVTRADAEKALRGAGGNPTRANDILQGAKTIADKLTARAKTLPDPKLLKSELEKEVLEREKRGFVVGEFAEKARARIQERRLKKEFKEKTERQKTKLETRIKDTRKELHDLFNQHIEDALTLQKVAEKWLVDNGVGLNERGKLIAGIKNIAKAKTLPGKIAQLDNVIVRAQELKLQAEKRANLKKIEDLFKKELKPKKNQSKKKVGPISQIERLLPGLEKLTKLSGQDFEVAELGLTTEIERLRMESKFDEALKLEGDLLDLHLFGNLKDREPHVAERAHNTLKLIIQEKKSEYKEFIATRKEAWDLDREAILDSLGEVDEFEFQQERVRHKGLGERINNWLADGLNKHLSLEQKLDKLADMDATGTIQALSDNWKKLFWHGNQTENTENRKDVNKLYAKIREIWKLKGAPTVAQKAGIEETQEQKVLRRMSETEVQFSIAIKDSNQRRDLTMSQDQALYIYLALGQPQLVDNMAANGYDNQTAQELLRVLPSNVFKLGQYMRDNLDKEYGAINEIHNQLFGTDLPKNVGYFPFRPDTEDASATDAEKFNQGLVDVNTMLKPGALISRVKHGMKVSYSKGATEIFLGHKMQMNRFKTYAVGSKDFFAILGEARVKRTIQSRLGESFYKELMEHASQTVSGGNTAFARNDTLARIKGLFIYKALGGNIGVFIKQLSSFPAYYMNMGTVDFFKAIGDGLVSVATKEGRAEYQKLIDTEFIQNRWNQGNHIEALYVLKNANKSGFLGRLAKASMITTRTGDLVPVLLMGKFIYNQAYNEAKAKGLSNAEASRHAQFVFGSMTEQSQQSSSWKDRTHWQRNGTLGEVMSMFQTSPRQYFTLAVRAIERARARGGADANLRAAKIAFISFGILPAAFAFAGNFFKYVILDDDDDRDQDEVVRNYLADAMKSPFSGIFFTRYISDNLIEKIVNGKVTQFGEDLPIASIDKDIIALFSAGYAISQGDPKEVFRHIENTFPAVKQSRKFIKNRIE